jgi:hypothetical protein
MAGMGAFLQSLGQPPDEVKLRTASKATSFLLDALLGDAGSKLPYLLLSDSDKDTTCCVVMATILWFHSPDESTSIAVRGHVYTSAIQTNPIGYNPNPIRAAIALSIEGDTADLPSRKGRYPEAKLSAWSRDTFGGTYQQLIRCLSWECTADLRYGRSRRFCKHVSS